MKKNAFNNNKNQMDSFFHQPTPKRVGPRMGNQKNRGNKGMRKGAR